MTRPLRRLVLALAAAASAGPVRAEAGDGAATPAPIEIADAWTRARPAGGAGGAFLTLTNTGNAPDRLVAATSPVAGAVELHESARDADGVATMRPVEGGIALPPGEPVALAPGGLHVMLIGLAAPLVEGETIPLTLTFETAGETTVEVPVKGAVAMDGGHKGH